MSRDFRAVEANDKREDFAVEPKTVMVVKNIDNDGLLPRGNEKVLIGCVPEVNGAEAVEVHEFIPTVHEIVQTARYWYLRLLENDWYYFIYGQTGSSEFRVNGFACQRIDRAAEVIGAEAVEAAIKEAREEFKAKINDDRLWNIWENGTQEQWDQVVEENARWATEHTGVVALELMGQLEKKHPDDSVALVLQGPPTDKDRAVLISSVSDLELLALLQVGGRLEIETDRSKVKTLILDQKFYPPGCLLIRRHEGSWVVVESASDLAGGDQRKFLEDVAGRVRKLLGSEALGEQEEDDLDYEV